MKIKSFTFFVVLTELVLIYLVFNEWLSFFPQAKLTPYVFALILIGIGLLFLPFMSKVKIASMIEFERLEKEIIEIENKQYLGEVVAMPSDCFYYIDAEGYHLLPDKETAIFLKSNKGIINIKSLKKYKESEKFESIKEASLYVWEEHYFAILNFKKYYINSWSLIADSPLDKNNAIEKTKSEIAQIQTGR